MGLADISGRHLGFTDMSVSAKTTDFIGLCRSCEKAVIFLTHPDNWRWKAQRTKSRQLSCSTASRCVFMNKQTRWTVNTRQPSQPKQKHHQLIRLIKWSIFAY